VFVVNVGVSLFLGISSRFSERRTDAPNWTRRRRRRSRYDDDNGDDDDDDDSGIGRDTTTTTTVAASLSGIFQILITLPSMAK
jgi:hypothetical protein